MVRTGKFEVSSGLAATAFTLSSWGPQLGGDQGKVTTFDDIYALDRKVAAVMGGKAVASAAPVEGNANTTPAKPKAPKENVTGSLRGLFGD